MSFVVGGISSNSVVIDVTGTMTMTYAPTNNYYLPTNNYPGYYNPYSYYDPQAALDLQPQTKHTRNCFTIIGTMASAQR